MTTAWLLALVDIGSFCMGAGVAVVRLVGMESHEGRRV